VVLGDRVILHPGVRIGQDGFGYAMGPQGHLKVPQLGRVIVGDDVEVGANSTIDQACFRCEAGSGGSDQAPPRARRGLYGTRDGWVGFFFVDRPGPGLEFNS